MKLPSAPTSQTDVISEGCQDKFGKTLIIYYSLSNNTKEIARLIQRQTGAALHEIKTIRSYPAIPEVYRIAEIELSEGPLPELASAIPDLNGYDFIFVGGPVWVYTLTPALLSFFRIADFHGKLVVPFCTHQGGYGNFFARFPKEVQNANILGGQDFYYVLRQSTDKLEKQISAWLKSLPGAAVKI